MPFNLYIRCDNLSLQMQNISLLLYRFFFSAAFFASFYSVCSVQHELSSYEGLCVHAIVCVWNLWLTLKFLNDNAFVFLTTLCMHAQIQRDTHMKLEPLAKDVDIVVCGCIREHSADDWQLNGKVCIEIRCLWTVRCNCWKITIFFMVNFSKISAIYSELFENLLLIVDF